MLDHYRTPFPLSEQSLTAIAKKSYRKRYFAKAEGHKTENREGDTHPQRGGRRVKNCTLAKKGKRERNHGIDDLKAKGLPRDFHTIAIQFPSTYWGQIKGIFMK